MHALESFSATPDTTHRFAKKLLQKNFSNFRQTRQPEMVAVTPPTDNSTVAYSNTLNTPLFLLFLPGNPGFYRFHIMDLPNFIGCPSMPFKPTHMTLSKQPKQII